MDAFKAHFTEDAAATMLIGHTGIVKVPAGCTSKVQTLDVCIKKPFRSILRKYWEEYVVKVVKNAGNEGMKPWFNVLLNYPELSNPWLVRNDGFLKRTMANVEADSDRADYDDDMFKDLFEN